MSASKKKTTNKKSTAKKAQATAKKNPIVFIIAFVLVVVLAAGLWFSGAFSSLFGKGQEGEYIPPDEYEQEEGSDQNGGETDGDGNGTGDHQNGSETPIETEELSIHFLELGNYNAGDCVLIDMGDTEILIDGGSKYNSVKTIVPYIRQYCADGTLEYVVATHAHEDHIAALSGGASKNGVLYSFSVGTIIDFSLTNSTSKVYQYYCEARDYAVENGATHYTALECWNETGGAQRTYRITDEISFQILYNYYYENKSSDENNYSVCLLLTQGSSHYLFTGDLEAEGEEYLVQYNDLPRCKLFKAGHHGSPTSSNDCLLSVIQPEIVCVCCCAGSDEYTSNLNNQFPSQAMIDRVSKYTDRIYVTTLCTDTETNEFTSMNGNIVVTGNGADLSVDCSNNNTILKDTEWFQQYRTWNGQ